MAFHIQRNEVAHAMRGGCCAALLGLPLDVGAGFSRALFQPQVMAAHDRVLAAQTIKHTGQASLVFPFAALLIEREFAAEDPAVI